MIYVTIALHGTLCSAPILPLPSVASPSLILLFSPKQVLLLLALAAAVAAESREVGGSALALSWMPRRHWGASRK